MPASSSELGSIRGYLAGRDAPCPGCGFNLRGNRTGRCPECGRELTLFDLPEATRPLRWRVHVFDLAGWILVAAINGGLALLWLLLVLGWNHGGWFTDPRWRTTKGPQSIAGVFLIVLGASLILWLAAWEFPSRASYRVQVGLTVWCWLLTAFHAVGVGALL